MLSFDCIIPLVLGDFRQRNQTPPPSKHMHLICNRWYIYECQVNYDASEGLSFTSRWLDFHERKAQLASLLTIIASI